MDKIRLLSWAATFKPLDVTPTEKIENAILLIKDAASDMDDSAKALNFNAIIKHLKLTL